jgi:hypothetical protein
MTAFNIRTALPQEVIDNLKAHGATVHDSCKMLIIDVLDSGPILQYEKFLETPKEVDPILTPHFGPPVAVYVPVNVQMEVYQLLEAYRKEQLISDAPVPQIQPLLGLVIPAGGGYQYRSQIAIQYVMKQIENPHVGLGLVGLSQVPSGTVICDLAIAYSNCVLIRRLRKI